MPVRWVFSLIGFFVHESFSYSEKGRGAKEHSPGASLLLTARTKPEIAGWSPALLNLSAGQFSQQRSRTEGCCKQWARDALAHAGNWRLGSALLSKVCLGESLERDTLQMETVSAERLHHCPR